MASIHLSHLHKSFGAFKAVKDVSVEIHDQEFFCMLGPSGCGKTTTLRMIAGLEMPDSGEIEIGGRDVTYAEPKDRAVGMVFQNYGLYPHLRVFDNIAYPLKVKRLSRDDIRQRVGDTANLLGIGDLLHRFPRQLSGGQQQRVSVARAIVREPRVCLMDEPISNLDAQLRAHMRGEIKRLMRELGTTTVFVTHDQLEAMAMADRIMIMCDGALQQIGTPHQIFRQPANAFIAGFIGDPAINFVDGSLETVDGTLNFVAAGLRVPLEARLLAAEAPQHIGHGSLHAVKMGIRPKNVELSHSNTDGTWLTRGEVFVVEPRGEEQVVRLQVEAGVIRAVVSAEFGADIGDRVWMRFDSDHLLLFDGATGVRLGGGTAAQ
jgi:multiple sugar transport system ATP-binding protein